MWPIKLPKYAKNAIFVEIFLYYPYSSKKKTKLIFFWKRKKEKEEENDKCKINPCGWPKLQIARCEIKNNSKVFKVGKK
jgi:hypothetical protein